VVVNFIMADPAVDKAPMFAGVLVGDPPANAVIGSIWNGSSFVNPYKVGLQPPSVGGLEML
jgi:hypothetical protein